MKTKIAKVHHKGDRFKLECGENTLTITFWPQYDKSEHEAEKAVDAWLALRDYDIRRDYFEGGYYQDDVWYATA
jgi:hypothetical protein